MRPSVNRIRLQLSGAAIAAGFLLAPSAAHADTAGLRPDGSILALVSIADAGYVQQLAAAVRPDGSLDPDYGHHGALRHLRPGARLAVLPDGRARVLSSQTDCSPDPYSLCSDTVFLGRYDADGDAEGAETALAWGDSASGRDVAPAGDEVLALTYADGTYALQRLDAENAAAGPATTLDFPPGPARVLALGTDALVVGMGGVFRLGSDGLPAAGYGDDGSVDTGSFWPRAAAQLSGGAVALTGTVAPAETTSVMRIDAAGQIDGGFAGDGRAEVDAGAGRPVRPVEIAADGDGMLVAGTTAGDSDDFAIARLTSTGALDTAYGTGGRAIADFDGRDDVLTGLVALPGGGAVAVGTSRPVGGGTLELALARYDAGGTLDPEFGDGGLARIPFDVVPPVLEVQQAPGPYAETGPSITAQASSPEAAAVVECSVDGGQASPCGSPVTFGPLDHGKHSLAITATDADGNQGLDRRTFVVLPDTAPGAGPPAASPSTSATFEFSSATSGSAHYAWFECRLDGAAWETCTSPWTVTGLAEGEHTAEVRQAIVVGPMGWDAVELDPARFEWRVDVHAPVTSVVSGPPPRTSERSAAVVFTSDDREATAECRLDGGGWQACASPMSVSGLGVGAHALAIRSIDAAGNREAAGPVVRWEVAADPAAALAERRAAAAAGLSLRRLRSRRPLRAGLRLEFRSAVDALAHVRAVVRLKGSRRRVRLAPLDARILAARPWRPRLRFPRAARALARKAGRRALSVRVTITLADPGAELVTRSFRVRLRR